MLVAIFGQALPFPNSMATAVSDAHEHGAHAMALCRFLQQGLAGIAGDGRGAAAPGRHLDTRRVRAGRTDVAGGAVQGEGRPGGGRRRIVHWPRAIDCAAPLERTIRRKHYLVRRSAGFRYEFKGVTIESENRRAIKGFIDASGMATIKINI
ncbi:hypothetical protein [Burkholderia contaminans]|uniref:hypothetical protein n=1 Tax=Burkholderia contaminans TaxID=488447 RepID=UPI001FC896B6|nr:hypothetical protein [Burkholderia contaminans]